MCHKPEGTGMPGVLIIGTKYGSPESLGLCFPLAKPQSTVAETSSEVITDRQKVKEKKLSWGHL